MSSAWIIWLTFCGSSLGNASNSAQSDLLMASVSDAVRNGATVISRLLNPKTSAFLPFVFQKLSEKIKKLDKTPSEEGDGEENELILIMLRLMGVDSRNVSDLAFNGVISFVLLLTNSPDFSTATAYVGETIFRHSTTNRSLNCLILQESSKVVYSFQSDVVFPLLICLFVDEPDIIKRRRDKEDKKGSFEGFSNVSLHLKPTSDKFSETISEEKEEGAQVLSSAQQLIYFFKVVSLLAQMQDPNLVDLIIRESEIKVKNNPEKDVECIKLLLCRTKPFVQGMQRSLKFFLKREKIKISGEKIFEGKTHEEAAWEAENLEGRMYFFAPSMREVVESGAQCDQLFPDCIY